MIVHVNTEMLTSELLIPREIVILNETECQKKEILQFTLEKSNINKEHIHQFGKLFETIPN